MRMVIRGVVALVILAIAYWGWALAGPRGRGLASLKPAGRYQNSSAHAPNCENMRNSSMKFSRIARP
jgi:hypothetical protein